VKVSETRNKSRLCCNVLDICQTIQMVAMVAHICPSIQSIWNMNILFSRATVLHSMANVTTPHGITGKNTLKFDIHCIFLIFIHHSLSSFSLCLSYLYLFPPFLSFLVPNRFNSEKQKNISCATYYVISTFSRPASKVLLKAA
jgi:hypothetical protein